jgi:hypothetical protein
MTTKDQIQTHVLAILRAGRDLITKPEKYTKGAYAKDSSDRACSALSADASCYCSLGAAFAASDKLGHLDREAGTIGGSAASPFDLAVQALAQAVPAKWLKEVGIGAGGPDTKAHQNLKVARYNDIRTHGDVLTLWDTAIAKVEAKLKGGKT